MWRIIGAFGLLFTTCSRHQETAIERILGGTAHNCQLSSFDSDSRLSFELDPASDYQIEFGRGSGWHGLDTVKVGQDGSVLLHRMKREYDLWENATMRFSEASLAKLNKAVEANDLMNLHKAYHGDVHDGSQWVLWIKQGSKEKAVYFNNHFPNAIVQFARTLDEVLADSGFAKLTWQQVPTAESRQHEREIWQSIKR